MPLETAGITPAQQIELYSTYEVVDDLVLPAGFTYEVIAAWGDKVGDSRFISGLEDGRYLKATGPAAAVFRKKQGQGYIDGLSDGIIGSFANCAGGTTPWGTVLSAEENFQAQVPESVYADGTAFDPSKRAFALDDEELYGQGNVFGLAGNKYGWIVEVDPAEPKDYGTKHTWLGRYRHEAVGVRVSAGKQLAFYSGCDRRGGHTYKFVSRDAFGKAPLGHRVRNPQDKANSQLLQNGMLYAAKFNDISSGKLNKALKSRIDEKGKPASLLGSFGNNSIWFIPTTGADAGKAYLFGMGPMECETTGSCFTPDQQTMFLSVQHPGEVNGSRKNQASESREFAIANTEGKEFLQTRQVPIGSNWPCNCPNAPPKPAVVAIQNNQKIS